VTCLGTISTSALQLDTCTGLLENGEPITIIFWAPSLTGQGIPRKLARYSWLSVTNSNLSINGEVPNQPMQYIYKIYLLSPRWSRLVRGHLHVNFVVVLCACTCAKNTRKPPSSPLNESTLNNGRANYCLCSYSIRGTELRLLDSILNSSTEEDLKRKDATFFSARGFSDSL
jgi:hypothetical protein